MRPPATLELALVILMLTGCSPAPGQRTTPPVKEPTGTFHIVRQGENLYRLSLYYYETKSVEETLEKARAIREANELTGDIISVGQRLFIPGTARKQPPHPLLPPAAPVSPPATPPAVTPVAPASTSATRTDTRPVPVPPQPILKETEFIWPASGKILCGYGEMGSTGIDILVTPGSAVRASKDGTVSFAGTTAKYGETVILSHANGYYTIYGHDISLLVTQGMVVKRGQAIAEVKGGSQKQRYLHFEVRKGSQSCDPLSVLPSPEQ